jgi:DNA primase small subunit
MLYLHIQFSDDLEKREFSFTLDGDIYLRFLAFKEASEFKEELKKKKPIKIDIGAVYMNS